MFKKINLFQDLNKELLNISLIAIFVFFLYLYNLNVNILYHKDIVPTGDPFSYVVNLLHAHTDSLNNYFKTLLKNLASSQWYYAYKLPLLIFSKIIPYEVNFYYFINYFYLLIYALSFFYFLQCLQKDTKKNILIVFLITVCPFLTGFESSISLNILMLDTQFFLLAISLFISTLSFLINQGMYRSIWVGIVGGLFIWSRGNSIFYFFILIFIPFIYYVYAFYKDNKIKIGSYNLIIPFVIIFLFSSWYFYFCYSSIKNYYSVHTNLINAYNYSFIGIFESFFKIILNYPGRLILNNLFYIKFLSILINLIVFLSIFLISVKNFRKKLKLSQKFVIISLYTYIIILIFLSINLSPWLNEDFYVDHATVIILLPLIVLVGIILQIILKRFKINKSLFFILCGLIFFLNEKQSESNYLKILNVYTNDYPELAKPKEVENFAINVFKETENKKIAILFYNFYNPPILDYYRLKNNLIATEMSNENVIQVIRPIAGDPTLYVSKKEYKAYLNEVINEYDYLIMPLYFNDYLKFNHLLISKYSEQTKEVFKKSNNKFIPIKILNDTIKLVLLKKVTSEENIKNEIYYPKINSKIIEKLPNDKFLPYKANKLIELFDNNISTFFEKHYLNKIEINIKLNKIEKLNSYYFEFGEHYPESISRLPKNWSIEIFSNLKNDWITVENQNNYKFEMKHFNNFPKFNLENVLTNQLKIVITNNDQINNILRIYNLKLFNSDNKLIGNDNIIKSTYKIF